MKPSLSEHRQGFTWLEMLIVTFVCLVAFLLIIPFFAPHHNHGGRQVSCMSNEKQIGLALLQYAQDNNNELPNGTQPTPGLGWAGAVYPYTKSVQLFQCPEEINPTGPLTLGVSYAYNSNIPRWFSLQKQTPTCLPVPSQTVLLFEVSGDKAEIAFPNSSDNDEGAAQGNTSFSAAGDGTASGLHSMMQGADHIHYATGDIGGRPGGANNQFNQARHQGGSNFLLADVHVKWFKPGQVSTGTDAPTPTAAQTGAISGTAAGTANPNDAATFSVK